MDPRAVRLHRRERDAVLVLLDRGVELVHDVLQVRDGYEQARERPAGAELVHGVEPHRRGRVPRGHGPHERAIDEENPRDARGLARDLRDIAADAQGLMDGLPEWEDSGDVRSEITGLIDLYTRAATQYLAFYNEEAPNLRRARDLRRQIARATPGANEAFAELETLGIACDDQPLAIEEF